MRHVTCTWCGSERGLSGTKLCDNCWEIKHRVEGARGPVRERILEAMGVKDAEWEWSDVDKMRAMAREFGPSFTARDLERYAERIANTLPPREAGGGR